MAFQNVMLAFRELCAAHRTEISFDTYKQENGVFKSISSKTEVMNVTEELFKYWGLNAPLGSQFGILPIIIESVGNKDVKRH